MEKKDVKTIDDLFAELREEIIIHEALKNEIKRRFQKAREMISRYSVDGKVIGYVSRISISRIGGGNFEIIFDIPPETYFENPISVGDILATINLSTLNLILLEVEEVRRADLLATLPIRPPMPSIPKEEPEGILTPTMIIAKPLLAMDEKGRIRIPSEPLEPQSPLFKPKPEVILRLLGLPESGVMLGCFVTAGGKALPDVPVMFPLEALYQHVLIIGTTGSGKTTFLKNFVLSTMAYNKYQVTEEMKPTIVIFDATGEYSQMILPKPEWKRKFGTDLEEEEDIQRFLYENVMPLKEVFIILPVTKKVFNELYEKAKKVVGDERNQAELAKVIGELLANRYFNERMENIIKALGGEVLSKYVSPTILEEDGNKIIGKIEILFEAKINDTKFSAKITILPWALLFRQIAHEIKSLCPIFTSQARAFFKSVLKALEDITRVDISATTLEDVIKKLGSSRSSVKKKTEVHEGTLSNIIRGLSMLSESGLFDVIKNEIVIAEPKDYGQLLSENKGKVVVVDVQEIEKAEFIIVYRILSMIFSWKKQCYEKGKRTHPVVIIIDEAHRYFPASGFAGEKESIQMIESMLKKICRLGRMRGLGIIFATHSQDDVAPIIRQLTNTKIAFRSEENLLEKLGIPKDYRTLLSIAPDRMALIKSHVFRTHMVFFKTTLPLAGHYDLSALSLSQ